MATSPDQKAELTAISAIASLRSERPRPDDRIYIEIGDISIDSKSVTLKDKLPVPGAQLALSGDVLVSTVRPGRGAVALAPLRAAVSPALAVLFGETAADTRFIFHVVGRPEFAAHLDKLATGSTYPTCSSRDVLEFMTAIPHPAERAQGVQILDTVDQTIRSTEELIVKLNLLRQGVLADLMTKDVHDNGELRDARRRAIHFDQSPIGQIPNRWDGVTLGEIAEIIDPNPSHRYPMSRTGGVPIVSTENFAGPNEYDFNSCNLVPQSVYKSQDQRCHFRPDDVVFARKGRLGFARPYGIDRKVFSHTIVLMKAKPHRCLPRFLLWTVRSEQFFRRLRLEMNSNVGVPTLGVESLARIPVPMPPIAEQTNIVGPLDALELELALEQQALQKFQRLKAALAGDLLTGRVRFTQPNKEDVV